MQAYALTIDKFLDYAAKWAGDREIVTAQGGVAAARIGYAGLRARSNLLSGAFAALGLRFGDRVGTLGWNTQHHLEVYYALMGAGLVCHTLNPRLAVNDLAAMINEAENRAVAVAANLAPLWAELAPLCSSVDHVILMDGDAVDESLLNRQKARVWHYEAFLDMYGAASSWGQFDEETPAGFVLHLRHHGQAKGRASIRIARITCTRCGLYRQMRLRSRRAMCCWRPVPMFHANGWGLPFAAPAMGAKLVLPGRRTDGASLAAIMREEGVTLAVGIQTVWLGVLDHLDATKGELPALKRVLIGGAKCPDALIERMERRLGARVQTSWGMTELSPMGTIASPDAGPVEARASGRPPVGLDLIVTDAAGMPLAEQRGVVGHLKVKGASVLDRYFKAEGRATGHPRVLRHRRSREHRRCRQPDHLRTLEGFDQIGRRVDQSRRNRGDHRSPSRRGSRRGHWPAG